MTKEELERRCAEMRAKYAATAKQNESARRQADTPSLVPTGRTRSVAPLLAPQSSTYEIDNPHPLIRVTLKGSRGLRPGWRAQEPMLVTAGDGRLDLRVGPESFRRALWIMDGFIKRFESVRLRVSVKDTSTLVEQSGQVVSIRIREGLQRLDVPAEERKNSWDSKYYWRPNGTLNFEIIGHFGRERKYSDSATSRLEQKSDRIVDSILELLEAQRRWAEEQRIAEIMRQHEARQEPRRQRQRVELQERAESLMNDVDAWHQSEKIRAYLAVFRARMEKWSGPIDPKTEVGKWLDWATHYADSLDPLNPARH
jgi:hypothetical protein